MSIVLSSIKRNFRDKSIIIGNIFLIMILPYIFSLIFSFDSINETVNLSILADRNSEIIKSYTRAIEEFDNENKNISVNYKISNGNVSDLNNDEADKSDLYVIIDEENKSIKFEGSNDLNISEKVIENLTKEFFNLTSIYEFIAKQGNVVDYNNKIVKVSEYDNGNNSTYTETIDYGQYFSVVMLQMAILSASISSFKSIFYIKEKIGERVKSSPIKMSKLISLELLGSFLVILSQGIIMLVVIKLFYNVNVNMKNISQILLLISLLSVFSVCIGIFTSAICKKRSNGENVCSIIVTIMALASGSLMPQMNGFIENVPVLNLNPFTWISGELDSLVTLNTSENLYTAICITLIACMLTILVSVLILKRKVVK